MRLRSMMPCCLQQVFFFEPGLHDAHVLRIRRGWSGCDRRSSAHGMARELRKHIAISEREIAALES